MVYNSTLYRLQLYVVLGVTVLKHSIYPQHGGGNCCIQNDVTDKFCLLTDSTKSRLVHVCPAMVKLKRKVHLYSATIAAYAASAAL